VPASLRKGFGAAAWSPADRGQVVVDRGRRQALVDQGVLPGNDVAFETTAGTVVTVGVDEEADEAIEMQGDLRGDRGGAWNRPEERTPTMANVR